MARHLGNLDYAEVASLVDHIADWLQAHGVAGSILGHYSLYTALQEEHEKARLAVQTPKVFGDPALKTQMKE